jgi:hypothetical protein
MKTQRGSRGKLYTFFNLGAKCRCMVNVTPQPLYPRETGYPLYRRLSGHPDQSGRERKFSPPTWIRSPDRPARSESLYRLRCPDSQIFVVSKDLQACFRFQSRSTLLPWCYTIFMMGAMTWMRSGMKLQWCVCVCVWGGGVPKRTGQWQLVRSCVRTSFRNIV